MSDVLVLAYHAASRNWPAALAVQPTELEKQLSLLQSRGYRGATFHDAVHAPPSERTVAVTFDDGYHSVLDLAYPILRSMSFPATVFVATDFPDQNGPPMSWPGIDQWVGGPYAPELRALSWSQLRTLTAAGWEIGSHSRRHPNLTQISDEQLAHELRDSRERCEQELQRPCTSLSYPYGAHDRRVVEAARRAGYLTAATVPDSLASVDYLTWPRVGVWHDDGLTSFRLKVSPLVRRFRRTPVAEPMLLALRHSPLRRAHPLPGES